MKLPAVPLADRFPPVLIGGLTAMWLLLNSFSVGHVVAGLLLSAALTWVTAPMRPLRPRVRRVRYVPPLLGAALADIVRSNLGVAVIVLGLVRGRRIQSGFVRIPLTLRDPHGLAVLASIVTSTPGTVWVDLDVEASVLTLHVLDLRDEQDWIDWIKTRYEPLLLAIFE